MTDTSSVGTIASNSPTVYGTLGLRRCLRITLPKPAKPVVHLQRDSAIPLPVTAIATPLPLVPQVVACHRWHSARRFAGLYFQLLFTTRYSPPAPHADSANVSNWLKSSCQVVYIAPSTPVLSPPRSSQSRMSRGSWS